MLESDSEIKMLQPEEVNDILQKSLEKFHEAFYNKSFSGRHPELGKMVNCHVCGYRHRANKVCEVRGKFIREPKQVGKSFFNKQRIRPRPSVKARRLIELTRELYPEYEFRFKPINAMKAARAQAGRILRQEQKIEANRYRQQQNSSRQINRG